MDIDIESILAAVDGDARAAGFVVGELLDGKTLDSALSMHHMAIHSLEPARVAFADGDRTALARALWLADILGGYPLPKWVRREFSRAWIAWLGGEATNYGDALGLPKLTHPDKRRRWTDWPGFIWQQVNRRQAAGEAIDSGMFEKISEEIKGMCKGMLEALPLRHELDPPLRAELVHSAKAGLKMSSSTVRNMYYEFIEEL